jgi:mRNA interferase RelE/StbE
LNTEPERADPSSPSSPAYEVRASNESRLVQELRAVPKRDLARIERDILALAVSPRPPGAEKLTGEDIYRIRRGDFRIVYKVYDDERLVLVGGVRRRNERTYRDVSSLFP